ncbi:MAG: sigma 54-interacting transcriptional regulator, partial [Acidobacteriota bacterium]
VQAMLLRTLETGEVRPVGSERSYPVDVRLIAATDAELEARVEDGSFRAPLLHRLAGYPLYLPPLRERRDDIGRLLYHFFEREALQITGLADVPSIPAHVVARLTAHDWPGNVRELRNVARQMLLAARGGGPGRHERLAAVIERALASSRTDATGNFEDTDPDLPNIGTEPITVDEAVTPLPSPAPPPPRRRPADIDDDELLAALVATKWRPTEAARRLGISRPSLYNLMDRSERVRTAAMLEDAEIEAARIACNGNLDAMAAKLEVSRRGLARRLNGE